jgi:hypothetical protein
MNEMKKNIILVLILIPILTFAQYPTCKRVSSINETISYKQYNSAKLQNGNIVNVTDSGTCIYDSDYNMINCVSGIPNGIKTFNDIYIKYWFVNSNSAGQIIIQKFNSNNELINTILINDSNPGNGGYIYLKSINFDQNGNLYIFVNDESSGGSISSNYSLYKYDTEFDLLWKKDYNTDQSTSGYSGFENITFNSSGSKLFITGGLYYLNNFTLNFENYSITNNDNNGYRLFLLEVDTNDGSINNLRDFGTTTFYSGEKKIYSDGSHLYYVYSNDTKIEIRKYSQAGTLIYQNIISSSVGSRIYNSYFYNNNIYIVGYGRDINFGNGFSFTGERSFYSILNANNGVGLDAKFFEPNQSLLLESIVASSNNQIIIGGRKTSDNFPAFFDDKQIPLGSFMAELTLGIGTNGVDFYNQNTTSNSLNPNNYLNKSIPIRFKVKVENELTQSVSTLSGTLTSTTTGVTITDNTVNFDNIASNTSGWSNDEFEIIVDESVASGTLLEFQLETQDQVISGGPWVSNFSFPIEPLVNGELIVVDSSGDNDNIVEPGETIKLFPKISNASTNTIANVNGNLSTEDPLSFIDSTNNYNVISNTQTPIEPSDTDILPEFPFEFTYPSNEDFQELNFDLELQGNLNDSNGILLKWVNTLVLNEGEDPILPPTITNYTPLDNATDVPIEANLVLEFDKDITAVSGKYINIYKADNTLINAIEANEAFVSITNNQVTIDATSNLNDGTSYYVLIDEGAFIDNNNTNFEGITDATTWNFTTVLNNPPNAPVISLTNISASEITISWDAVDSANSYQILSCDESITYEASTTETSFTATNFTPETSYNFIVKAKNDVGFSEASNCVSAETLCSNSWGNPMVSGGNSTTAYCIVTINNQPAGVEDLVGVFVGNELRGLGTIIISSGIAYSTIVIDGSTTETITFKVWDSSNCEELSVSYTTETNLGEIGLPPNYLPINAEEGTASTEEINLLSDNFIIYPNPIKSILKIENTSSSEISSIEIFNMLGKKVKSKETNFNVINISKFSKGIYFLKIKTDKGSVIKKIIKE